MIDVLSIQAYYIRIAIENLHESIDKIETPLGIEDLIKSLEEIRDAAIFMNSTLTQYNKDHASGS